MQIGQYFIPVEMLPYIKVILSLVFGMILGIERVLAGRTAGPRTYGLVAVGACLIAILAENAQYIFPVFDPAPFLASIITGVGFIGAGLIVLHGSRLSGLTTAAGIWVSAIIGIAVGMGFLAIATFVTFLTLFVFTIMWRIEEKMKTLFTENAE